MHSAMFIFPLTLKFSSPPPSLPFNPPPRRCRCSSVFCDSFSSSTGTCWVSKGHNAHCISSISFKHSYVLLPLLGKKRRLICRAAEYKFPDPIPEFADSETEKFKNHLIKKLSKKDLYGDSLAEVIGICTEIFSTFLHSEYGGPGTLLVIPFIDMADTLNERGLPGGPQAARAAVKWAQEHVDKDWKEWTNGDSNE